MNWMRWKVSTALKGDLTMRWRALLVVLTAAGALTPMSAVSASGGQTFSTDLTGAAEVTAEGVPNQGDLDGSGQATITINRGQGEICWSIQVENITLPALAAHIHVGPPTTTGPIVVTLSPPGADGASSGCASVDRELAKTIAKDPGAYYVNVHTTDFMAGAVRGQLG
jgi:hypothetical protein